MGYGLLTGLLVASAVTLGYVLVLYIRPEVGDRNDPKVIKSRLKRVLVWMSLVAVLLPVGVSYLARDPVLQVGCELGILPGVMYDRVLIFEHNSLLQELYSAVNALLLVFILFIGPLADYVFVRSSRPSDVIRDVFQELSTLEGVRDLLVGPLTEEFIYTAAPITVLRSVDGVSTRSLVILPTLFFSFAHVHHALELRRKKAPLLKIVLITLFQATYTFIFGAFTDFLFLRTGSLASCVLGHSFCNFLGFPALSVDAGPQWRAIYTALLPTGLFLFWMLLYPLTESPKGII